MAGGFGSRTTGGKSQGPTFAAPAFGSRVGGQKAQHTFSAGGGFGSRTSSSPSESKSRSGVLGVLENLGTDAKAAILGLPEGIVQTVEHPVKTAKQVGKSYKETYAPLFHGDVGEFLHGVGQHPLGPLLDLASLLTLGGAAAAKAGLADSALSQVELRSPAALDFSDEANAAAAPVLKGKTFSRNPVIRARQQAVDKALKKLPPSTKVVGEIARYGREGRRGALKNEAGNVVKMRDYTAAWANLNKNERVATSMLARLPLQKDLDEWKSMLEHDAAKGNGAAEDTLKLISDPKVQELYAHPNDAMLKAHTAAGELGKVQASILNEKGALTPELAETARYRHMRITRGAESYTPGQARKAARQIDRQIAKVKKQQATIKQIATKLREKGTPESRQLRREATISASQASRKVGTEHRLGQAGDRVDQLREQLATTNTKLEQLMGRGELTSQEALDNGLRSGSDVDQLRLRLIGRYHDQATTLAHRYENAINQLGKRERIDEALPTREELATRQTGELDRLHQVRSDIASRLVAGRKELDRFGSIEEQLQERGAELRPGIVGGPPIAELKADVDAAGRPQPIYLPDTAAVKRGGHSVFGTRTATSAAKSPVTRSEGTLFRIGQLALEPNVLSPEYLRTVKYSLYRDLHEQLLESAVRTPYYKGVGAELKPGHVWVRRALSAGRNEQIGYVEQTRGEFRRSLASLIPDAEDAGGGEIGKVGLTSTDLRDALVSEGFRYQVPEPLAKQLSGEFEKGNKALQWFIAKPTTVWRALVLNLRVGWLTNNIVGNHLLYAIKEAGPAGLRAYLDAVRTSKGAAAARDLLQIKSPDALDANDIADLFPEQAGGTFIGTQRPRVGGTTGRVVKASQKATRKLTEANQASEGALRRASVNAQLRRSPEVRARLRAMPKEVRSFREAAKQELAANPALAREVSDHANSVLGDFLNMSPAERRYVRAIFPFYSWYRAITTIALKLPLDNPVRTSILTRLGEVGEQDSNAELGPLPSYLEGAIPLGGDRLLKTQGINPLATLPQIAPGIGAILAGHPGDAATAELSSNLNPVLQGLIEQITGRDVYSGSQLHQPGWARGIVPGIVENIGAGLPETRLIKTGLNGPPPSKLYKPSSVDELLAFLGIPTRTINTYRASQLAREGA